VYLIYWNGRDEGLTRAKVVVTGKEKRSAKVRGTLLILPKCFSVGYVRGWSHFSSYAITSTLDRNFNTLDMCFNTLDMCFNTLDMCFNTLETLFNTLDVF